MCLWKKGRRKKIFFPHRKKREKFYDQLPASDLVVKCRHRSVVVILLQPKYKYKNRLILLKYFATFFWCSLLSLNKTISRHRHFTTRRTLGFWAKCFFTQVSTLILESLVIFLQENCVKKCHFVIWDWYGWKYISPMGRLQIWFSGLLGYIIIIGNGLQDYYYTFYINFL